MGVVFISVVVSAEVDSKFCVVSEFVVTTEVVSYTTG